MIDPVKFQRMSEFRQKEYLALVEYERKTRENRVSMTEVASKLIARLTALIKPVAPARTVTAPDITAEPCVEC